MQTSLSLPAGRLDGYARYVAINNPESLKEKERSIKNLKVSNLFYNTLIIVKKCAKSSDPLERITKNSYRFLDILSKIRLITDPALVGLSALCKGAADVFESMRFVGVVKSLVVPQKNNKYFLFDPENSTQEKCDRLCLLGHTAFKNLRSLHRWKLIELGKFGTLKIGSHLTLFHLLTDGWLVASCSFYLWGMNIKLNKMEDSASALKQKTNNWQFRPQLLAKASSLDLVKIAGAVSKIFVISMALTMMAANICSTIPSVFLLSCGIISDSIGIIKFLYEKEVRLKPIF